ncbi:MAG: ornithine carbamoyltransferase [Actinomycetota bacterium]|nr:ornithine carbamoyltransferase [Actinomycetota bacterium]
MTVRHLLSSDDIDTSEQLQLTMRAIELKKQRGSHVMPLMGTSVGLIFEKPSTRTRVSFEVAVRELGGHAVVLRGDELQLGRGETIEDTGRVLSRYLHAIAIRTFGQERLESLADSSTIPIINALSDLEHPCQALADVMTIAERFPDAASVNLAYLGDGNNVCHSLLLAAAKAGYSSVTVACPEGFEPIEPIVEQASAIGKETGCAIEITNDPVSASKGANVLYTDVWTSMGQEEEKEQRLESFRGFEVSSDRLAEAALDVIVLHCLPAHRGEEIDADVIDGPSSAVWDQAENRLHAQKALLEFLIAKARKT